MDQTMLNFDLETQNDQDSIILKATILAKYMTLNQVLERSHGVNETQLKRVLYKAYYDEIEASRGFTFKIKKWWLTSRKLKKQ